jgi:beta-1,4-mannosyltransferase
LLISHVNGRNPTVAVGDALRMISAVAPRAGANPGVVAYFPVFRGNPYQSILYSALPTVGLGAAPIYGTDQAVQLADVVHGSDIDVVVHLHWLHLVTSQASDEEAARANAKEFIEDLNKLRDLGTRLLWTVHNVLPHDDRFPDVDVQLCRDVVSIVDRVHVMSPRTCELSAPWFRLPTEKVFVIPHPSYDGAYPNWLTHEQARVELGIPSGVITFALVGAVKPYKGLTELLNAFDQLVLAEPGRFMLLVAGQPDDTDETRSFCERALLHPATLASFRKIPAEDIQLYLKAADVAIFPYRRSLNSGALSLALTFGLPMIVPTHSGEADGVDSSYAELEAMSSARRLVAADARVAARAAAERVAAPKVAQAFADEMCGWLDSAMP